MKPRNLIAVVYLSGLALAQTVAASSGDPVAFQNVPQWMIYVGLAVVCPEDINRAIRDRLGSPREGEVT